MTRPADTPSGLPTNGASNGNGALRAPAEVRIETLSDLATKYNFSEPDGWVGSESSQLIVDYGEPIVLADSVTRSEEPRGLLGKLLSRF